MLNPFLLRAVAAVLALSLAGCGPEVEQAKIVASTTSGFAPLLVQFDGSALVHADDASQVTYTWSFGDGGTTMMGTTVSHSYRTPGAYTAQLLVQAGDDRAIATTNVTVNAIPKPTEPGVYAATTTGLVALRERTEDYATIVDGRKSIYDAFLARPVYYAVRAARITQVHKEALVCLVFLRVSAMESLSIHPVSTIPARDYKRNVWRHRDRRDQLKIDDFPKKYTHKLGEKLPIEQTTVEPGLVHLRLGEAPAGLYAGWINDKFWYFELTEEAPPPVDLDAQRQADILEMVDEDIGDGE